MRQSTYETLSALMRDIGEELDEELQDEVERLEFFYSMAGNPVRADALINVLMMNGYDPRPQDDGIPEHIKAEVAELTGNTNMVQPGAAAPRRGGRPKGSKNKVKKNGKSGSHVHEPAV